MSKSKWRSAIAVIAAIAAMTILSQAALASDVDNGLNAFVSTYQCSLAGLIERTIARRQQNDDNLFVTLSLPGPKARYVQCAFEHRYREGVCEAASGWWNNPWEKPTFSPNQLESLRHLGFSTDGSHGNFEQQMHFPPGGPEPYSIAELLLSALYVGYDAHIGMPIEVEAPTIARRRGFLPEQRCVPIS